SYIHGDELDIPAHDTKQRGGRVIPLVADLAEIIERRWAVRRVDSPLIFHLRGVRFGAVAQPRSEPIVATGLRSTPRDSWGRTAASRMCAGPAARRRKSHERRSCERRPRRKRPPDAQAARTKAPCGSVTASIR